MLDSGSGLCSDKNEYVVVAPPSVYFQVHRESGKPTLFTIEKAMRRPSDVLMARVMEEMAAKIDKK